MTASSQSSSLNNFETPKSEVTSETENLSHTSYHASFNAYPLECSSNLLNPTNEVIYMPLNPTNVPLSLQPASVSSETQNELPQSYSRPICHGFIFPNSDGINDNFGHASIPDVQDNSENVFHSVQNQVLGQNLSDLDYNAQRHLQLLLLQKLIELQLAQYYNTLKSTIPLQSQSNIQSRNQEPLPCNVQNFGLNERPNQNWAVNSEQSDMSTFLVPVEAKFEGESGLSLHITPRDDSSNTSQKGSVTVECPGQPIVLYPYTVQHDGTQEETSPVSQSNTDSNASGPTAQALTIKDIHQCVRRGSFEFTPESSNDIVESIRGRTRPGFVLLSVRHEKIKAGISPNSESGLKKIHSSPNLGTANSETKTGSFSVMKKSRKRMKYAKSETELKRRSMRHSPKSFLESRESNGAAQSPVELTEDELKALSSQSRFRVTRFADKKQAWIAPSKASCLSVHDLWTTKLPEYVLKCAEHLKNSGSEGFIQEEKNNNLPYSLEAIINGRCIACQNQPPNTWNPYMNLKATYQSVNLSTI
uniref:Bromo domain-containing protein n=1 Tax=Trichobilharzia regenti TaxID=157069 RepID=A0AA85K8B5_TRIRE|nr:unnamed protein product [Trichobilharzia regenti]